MGDHKHKPGYIYVLGRKRDNAVKIGFSIKPIDRVKAMNLHPDNGRVVLYFQNAVLCMTCVERKAHRLFSDFRLPYEKSSGSSEWFNVAAEHAVRAVFAASAEIGKEVIKGLSQGDRK